MKTITVYLKQKYPDLPSNWHVYSIRSLDGDGEEIAELKGAIVQLCPESSWMMERSWHPEFDGGGE